jgi:hypothetical protein
MNDDTRLTRLDDRAVRVAAHEAGHAVVGLALGLPVNLVRIGPKGHRWRNAVVDLDAARVPNWYLRGRNWFARRSPEITLARLTYVEKHILFAWGGWLAERHYLKPGTKMRRFGTTEDGRQVRELQYWVSGEDHLYPVCRQRAESLVIANWHGVLMFTSRLLVQRILTGTEISELARSARIRGDHE